jgi:ubiquinone/menaquinone biosynthesis C-methylase UbiE
MSDYFANERIVAERIRLKRQDDILNKAMNVLTSLNMSRVTDILDIACGTGRWCIQVAQQYPEKRVIGIDNDPGILAFAEAQAETEDASVEFLRMNVLEPLQWPDASFDLVNMRLVCGFLHKSKWSTLLAECKRILRPGGILIATEQGCVLTNDSTYEQHTLRMYTAFHKAGHTFADDPATTHLCVGIALKALFRQAGFMNVTHRAFDMDFSTGTEAHEAILKSYMAAFENAEPFLIRFGTATSEQVKEALAYIHSLINKPDFLDFWHFMSITGQKPSCSST